MRSFLLASPLLLANLAAGAQTSLTKLASVALPSVGTELLVSGTTAYVFTADASQQTLRIYDVSTPSAPQLRSTLALPTFYNYPNLPPRHAALGNGTLYLTSYPYTGTTPFSVQLLIIGVSNPASPSILLNTSTGGSSELFVAASGDYFYTVGDNSNRLGVFARPTTAVSYSNPQRTINLPYSLSGLIGLTVNGSVAYVQYANAVFATLDLSNPAVPVSSPGTTPGAVSAASGSLGYGLAQPAYAGSVPANTLRFYSLSNPLQPVVTRAQAGSYGTRVAAGGRSVFTAGATNPYLTAVASSSEPLRGYYSPAGGDAPREAVATGTQGANALAAVGDVAYVLTDTELSVYGFPASVLATRQGAALAPLPLFPNPVAQGSQLSLPQLAPGTAVAFYDALGRCCLQATLPAERQLDLSALTPGLYQVRAGGTVSKLVVE